MAEAFSVLVCCYRGDTPDALESSVRSITEEQTLPPDEVVLVQDGPVLADLAERIARIRDQSTVPIQLVTLEENVGLGIALERGLAVCRNDIVARQDADDISLPQRFARQLPLVESGVDIVGSSMLEFGTSAADVVGRRVPLLEPAAIVRSARFHQTFYHPTVVYRASAVRAAGGYEDLPALEDYLLFAKMIMRGVTVANVEEPLVLYRVGEGAYARRGGWRLLRSEWELQRRFHAMGFTNRAQWLRNVVVRGLYRLVPEQARRAAYQMLLARRGERGSRRLRTRGKARVG